MDGDVSDLMGGFGQGSSSTASPDAQAAASHGVEQSMKPKGEGPDETEQALVKKLLKEYNGARAFDQESRGKMMTDRKYAAGEGDPSWASDANLIGSFIDILVSFLYAQNPDPGVRAAEQVDAQPDINASKFAQTMELVIYKLWKDGNLKLSGKKWVRSALSVGQGWVKATMLTQKIPAPQLEHSLATLQDQMQKIVAMQTTMSENGGDSTDDPEVQKAALQIKIQGVQAQLLKKQRYGMVCDFVRAEDMQVALNVADLADYEMADWLSSDIYVPKGTLIERFTDLTEDDVKACDTYYQKADKAPGSESGQGEQTGEGQFSKTQSGNADNTNGPDGKPVEFAKIIELWDRRDFMVKTMISGFKGWAVKPYAPPQASTRFYPFFYLAFFPVDGKRFPQSLPTRLRKLQDEYSACRSNQRKTRERSITGVVFNSAAVDPSDAARIMNATEQELIGVRTVADQPLSNIFIAKPVGTYNPALFDTAPIRADMEALSGVQEAMQQNAQQGSGQPKTATEAQIQQSGFASRTGSDRDSLEGCLTDLAKYTAEVSTQECSVQWVQRVCGPKAFWLGPDLGTPAHPAPPQIDQTTGQPMPPPVDPMTGQPMPPQMIPATPPKPGMDVEDVLTMVEVSIDAGTTGKPNLAADKANWATILPLLEKSLLQIRQMQLADPGLARALERLMEETLKRMDDRLDLEEFIPQGTPTPPPPPPPNMNITIALKGSITPEQEQMLLGAEAVAHGMGGPPGPGGLPAGPGAPPPHGVLPAPHGAPGVAPAITLPSHLPGGVPMPRLSLDKPAPAKPSAGPPPK